MKIDVMQVLKGFEGQELKAIDENGKSSPITVQKAINLAINGVEIKNGQVQPLTAEEKGRIYHLSSKIWSGKEVDFTNDDMVFIKERAGKVNNISPIIYGRLCDLFETKG